MEIDDENLLKAKYSTTISAAFLQILRAVFSKEELKNHTVQGKKGKPGLDKKKYQAAIGK